MISDFFEIFLLSIIQGVSEFIPVSSAAHLILTSNIYEFKNQSLLIDISLHLGSLLAILFYFKDDVFNFIDLENFAPSKQLTLEVIHSNKIKEIITLNHTYNKAQIEWFKAGSALNLIREENAK